MALSRCHEDQPVASVFAGSGKPTHLFGPARRPGACDSTPSHDGICSGVAKRQTTSRGILACAVHDQTAIPAVDRATTIMEAALDSNLGVCSRQPGVFGSHDVA